MTEREIVMSVLDGGKPPYVPWKIDFTLDAAENVARHLGQDQWHDAIDNHIANYVGPRYKVPIGDGCVRDAFGVVRDCSQDRDIGVLRGQLLPEPTLADLVLPAPDSLAFFGPDIPAFVQRNQDRFRLYNIGCSLFERAWSLRGMERLLMDFVEHPEFVHELLNRLADHIVARIEIAVRHDFDGMWFGDDWGQQRGLIISPAMWREFIKPRLELIYGAVHAAGKRVFIHCCGDVDELFPDLVTLGVDCFNPFQPEVMDVAALLPAWRSRLAFHGGLSTQRVLPFATPTGVAAATQELLDRGAAGGLIFAPAHAIEGDVPLENIIAMIETLQAQSGYLSR